MASVCGRGSGRGQTLREAKFAAHRTPLTLTLSPADGGEGIRRGTRDHESMIRPSRGGIRCAMTCAAPGAAASSLANASKPTIVVDPTFVSATRAAAATSARARSRSSRAGVPRAASSTTAPSVPPADAAALAATAGGAPASDIPSVVAPRRSISASSAGNGSTARRNHGGASAGSAVGAAGHRDQHRKCRAPQLRQRRVRDRWRLRGRIAFAAGRDDLARDRPDLGRKSGDDRTQDRRDLALQSGPQPSGVDVLDPVGDRRTRLPQEAGNGVRPFGAVHRPQRCERGTARRGVGARQRPDLGVTAGIATQGQRQNAPRGHPLPASSSGRAHPPALPPGNRADAHSAPILMTTCGAEGITAQSLLAPGAGGGYVSRP